jgi:hypothetical protein
VAGVFEFEGCADAATMIVDLIDDADELKSDLGPPVVRTERAEDELGFEVLRITGLEVPPSPVFPTGNLEATLAAKGPRLVVVVGEEPAGLLTRVLETAKGNGSPSSVQPQAQPHNGRLWLNVKKAVPLAGKLAGEPDATARMILGLAALVFEKGKQELSASVRMDREGLFVEVEAPPGFYAILAQFLNIGLGQLQNLKQ